MAIDEAAKSIKRRNMIFYIIIFFFILGLIAVWYSSYMGKYTKKGVIQLHGWIEGDEVSLSSKVTGDVIKLAVDEGSDVKKGDFVLQIDSRQTAAQLEAADAEVLNREETLKIANNNISILESKVKGAAIELELSQKQSSAKIREAKADFSAVEETLKQAEFNYIKAKKDYNRFLPLIKKKKISQSKMDSVEEIYQVCNAEVERSKKNLDKSKASLALAKTTTAEVRLKKNNLETLKKELERTRTEVEVARAKLLAAKAGQKHMAANLSDTYMYAPINGTIIEKFIEQGERVVPGTSAVLIVNMDKLYVKTYVEQIDIGKIKYNDTARIYVDSFPDRHFGGKIIFISPKAEFTPRDVQMDEHRSRIVYRVEVSVDKNEGFLKPGMPADVDIKWDKDASWK